MFYPLPLCTLDAFSVSKHEREKGEDRKSCSILLLRTLSECEAVSVSSDNVDDDLLLQSFNDDWSVLSRLRVSLSYSATIATRIHLS